MSCVDVLQTTGMGKKSRLHTEAQRRGRYRSTQLHSWRQPVCGFGELSISSQQQQQSDYY